MSAETTTSDFRYWAFLAYCPADVRLARWVLRRLETSSLPKALVDQPGRHGKVPKRICPIFLDLEELPLASVEGDQLDWALRHSRSLIVVCSAQAVASAEVGRQIRDFKALGCEDKVVCLVTGDRHASLEALIPKAARFQVDASGHITDTPARSLVIDLRRGGDSRRLACLRMIAHVAGVDLDDLRQRDNTRRRLRFELITAAVLLLFAFWSTMTIQLFVEKERADENLRIAERERDVALQAQRNARKARDLARDAERQAREALEAAKAERRKLEERIRRQLEAVPPEGKGKTGAR